MKACDFQNRRTSEISYNPYKSLYKWLRNVEIQLFLPIQSALSMNINSPIKKLIVSINQCLIYVYLQCTTWFTIFSIELRKQICVK